MCLGNALLHVYISYFKLNSYTRPPPYKFQFEYLSINRPTMYMYSSELHVHTTKGSIPHIVE